MKTPLGTEVAVCPCHIVLHRDPALPRKGHSSLPLFSAHVYCNHGRPSQLLLRSCRHMRADTQTRSIAILRTSRGGEVTSASAVPDETKQEGQHPLTGQRAGSFPTNIIAHLHGLSMDLTVRRTVGPTVDSTVGWTVRLTVKLCKHWFDSRSNY